MPLKAKNIARIHIAIDTINIGKYNDFSGLLNATYRSVGPRNIHINESPIVFSPIVNTSLSVRFVSTIIILNCCSYIFIF